MGRIIKTWVHDAGRIELTYQAASDGVEAIYWLDVRNEAGTLVESDMHPTIIDALVSGSRKSWEIQNSAA